MRVALYGLPCSGKTTLLSTLEDMTQVIRGSEELHKIQAERIEEKRRRLLQDLKNQDDFFIDGHYEFIQDGKKEIAFTDEDKVFDVFMYLYQNPGVILERLKHSEKNQKYLPATREAISEWQDDEIQSLRAICHKADKDFYVIDDWQENFSHFKPFCKDVIHGFSNVREARRIADSIECVGSDVTLCDGDKTILNFDTSVRFLGFRTKIFDNNFYTGYQFWMQDKIIGKEFSPLAVEAEIKKTGCNPKIFLKKNNSVILSSGLQEIWHIIGRQLGIQTFAGKTISAETKFFVTKFLRRRYIVTAYGDSLNDLFMLQEADKGYLVLGNRLSRSLTHKGIFGLSIINTVSNVHFLVEDNPSDKILDLVQITKSDSGIQGSRLARAHLQLGECLSSYFKKEEMSDITILSLERSGHFLADGLYLALDSKFHTYDAKFQELPDITTKRIILVDGVINEGKSMIEIIEKIEDRYRNKEISIVTNVINEKAVELFSAYRLVAVRKSKNQFKGEFVKKQRGNIGPDTADRLFNR